MSMIIDGTTGIKFPDDSIQAESMTDYGIGVVAPALSGNDADNAVLSGKNTYNISTAHRPGLDISGFPSYGIIDTSGYSSTGAMQTAIGIDTTNPPRTAVRVKNITWGPWKEIWNSASDGNGGQPPAPKPKTSDGNIGSWVLLSVGDSIALLLPAGGKWAYLAYRHNTSNGFLVVTNCAVGVAAGETPIIAAASGYGATGIAWRIE